MELQESLRRISHYGYAFMRMMELEAAWLPLVPSNDFKILLGHKIGYDGWSLKRLHRRIRQMLSAGRFQSSPEYAANFDRAAQLQGEPEIAGFLAAVTSDLEQSMQRFVESADPVADEPSVLTVQEILALVRKQTGSFRDLADRVMDVVSVEEESAAGAVEYSATEPIPELVGFPRREQGFVFDPKPILDPNETAESDRKFAWFVFIDIEIAAAEVCARNIVMFRDMPLEFKIEMATQVWDEARHAIILRDRYRALGGKEGEFTYTASVWRNYHLGKDLAEHLAIEQVVQEGNTLDSFLERVARMRAADPKTAAAMDFANADESCHVYYGNKWLMRLLGNSRETYERVLSEVSEKIRQQIPGRSAPNRRARSLAGFPDWYIDRLEDSYASRVSLGMLLLPDAIARDQGIDGVIVRDLVPGGIAHRAGLKGVLIDPEDDVLLGDVIVAIDDHDVRRCEDLLRVLSTRSAGDWITLGILRDEACERVRLRLQGAPPWGVSVPEV